MLDKKVDESLLGNDVSNKAEGGTIDDETMMKSQVKSVFKLGKVDEKIKVDRCFRRIGFIKDDILPILEQLRLPLDRQDEDQQDDEDFEFQYKFNDLLQTNLEKIIDTVKKFLGKQSKLDPMRSSVASKENLDQQTQKLTANINEISDDLQGIKSEVSAMKVLQEKSDEFGGKADIIQAIKKKSQILKHHLQVLEAYRNDQIEKLKDFQKQMGKSIGVLADLGSNVTASPDMENYKKMLKCNVKCLLQIDVCVDLISEMSNRKEDRYLVGEEMIQTIKQQIRMIEEWSKEYDQYKKKLEEPDIIQPLFQFVKSDNQKELSTDLECYVKVVPFKFQTGIGLDNVELTNKIYCGCLPISIALKLLATLTIFFGILMGFSHYWVIKKFKTTLGSIFLAYYLPVILITFISVRWLANDSIATRNTLQSSLKCAIIYYLTLFVLEVILVNVSESYHFSLGKLLLYVGKKPLKVKGKKMLAITEQDMTLVIIVTISFISTYLMYWCVMNKYAELLGDVDQNSTPNKVSNSKYSILTFVPYNLFGVQLAKLTNLYFAFTCFLQIDPDITISQGKSTMFGSLVFTIVFSMAKDAFESVKIYFKDKAENETEVTYYDKSTMQWLTKQWAQIRAGDLIKLKQDEQIPADIIAFGTSKEEEGVVKFDSMSLDGEQNLKESSVPHQISNNPVFGNLKNENLNSISGQILFTEDALQTSNKDQNLFGFEADLQVLGLGQFEQIPLNQQNVLLRGSTVRETKTLYGLVVFTGDELKIIKNNKTKADKTVKFSKLQIVTNSRVTIGIIIFKLLTCALASLLSMVYFHQDDIESEFYHKKEKATNIIQFLNHMGSWFLLLTNLIPISLWVCLEGVNVLKGMLIGRDLQMFDYSNEKQKAFCKVQSSNLLDELGQIEYIFSDKSGTITRNEMNLTNFVVGQQKYGNEPDPNFKQQNVTDDYIINDQNFQEALGSRDPKLKEFLETLSLCHSVKVNASGEFKSDSPDEVALVQFAKEFGIEFGGMDYRDNIILYDNYSINRSQKIYKFIDSIEFTSDRKMSSFILKDILGEDDQYFLLAKGADNVMKEKLSEDNDAETLEFNENQNRIYSSMGLRTLYFARRDITKDDYQTWKDKYEKARTDTEDKQRAIEEAHSYLESDLELVGISAIRDKLQEDVPETIDFLKEAGIKFWVITGDKVETTVNVSRQAGIINQHTYFMHCEMKSQMLEDELQIDPETGLNYQESITLTKKPGCDDYASCSRKYFAEGKANGATLYRSGQEDDDRIIFYHPGSKSWIITSKYYESEDTFKGGGGFQSSDPTNSINIKESTWPNLIVSFGDQICDINASDSSVKDLNDSQSSMYEGGSEDQKVIKFVINLFEEKTLQNTVDNSSLSVPQMFEKIQIICEQLYERGDDLRKVGLVIEGSLLAQIINEQESRNKFQDILDLKLLEFVVCCRVTPKQKSEVVELVRERHPTQSMLAIGDGLNDVSMIQTANIGVGIIGKEGLMAANSADFAIGQFRYLKRLLFIHGRESYRRTSILILYMIYKNALYVMAGHFWPGFVSAMSGMTIYDITLYNNYNLYMTSLHIVWYAVFDYSYCKENEHEIIQQENVSLVPCDPRIDIKEVLKDAIGVADSVKANNEQEKKRLIQKRNDQIDAISMKSNPDQLLPFSDKIIQSMIEDNWRKQPELVRMENISPEFLKEVSYETLLAQTKQFMKDFLDDIKAHEKTSNYLKLIKFYIFKLQTPKKKPKQTQKDFEAELQKSENWGFKLRYFDTLLPNFSRKFQKNKFNLGWMKNHIQTEIFENLSLKIQTKLKDIEILNLKNLRNQRKMDFIDKEGAIKETLLEYLPFLYKIGPDEKYFNLQEVLRTFIEGAFVDSLLIFVIAYLPLASGTMSDGHEFGSVAIGMTVYCASCFVADVWVMMKFSAIEIGSVLMLLGCFVAPHFFYCLYSLDLVNEYTGFMKQNNKAIYKAAQVEVDLQVLQIYLFLILFMVCKEIFSNQAYKLFKGNAYWSDQIKIKDQLPIMKQKEEIRVEKEAEIEQQMKLKQQQALQNKQILDDDSDSDNDDDRCPNPGCETGGILKKVQTQDGDPVASLSIKGSLLGQITRCQTCQKIYWKEELNQKKYLQEFFDYVDILPNFSYYLIKTSKNDLLICEKTENEPEQMSMVHKSYQFNDSKQDKKILTYIGSRDFGNLQQVIEQIKANKMPISTSDQYLSIQQSGDDQTQQLIKSLNLQKLQDIGELEVDAPIGVKDEEVNNLFTKKRDKKYCSGMVPDFTIAFKFKTPLLVTGYGFRTANDFASRDPGVFTLYDQDDNNLDAQDLTSEEEMQRFAWRRFSLKAPKIISELKFVVHKRYKDIEERGRCFQLNEFEISSEFKFSREMFQRNQLIEVANQLCKSNKLLEKDIEDMIAGKIMSLMKSSTLRHQQSNEFKVFDLSEETDINYDETFVQLFSQYQIEIDELLEFFNIDEQTDTEQMKDMIKNCGGNLVVEKFLRFDAECQQYPQSKFMIFFFEDSNEIKIYQNCSTEDQKQFESRLQLENQLNNQKIFKQEDFNFDKTLLLGGLDFTIRQSSDIYTSQVLAMDPHPIVRTTEIASLKQKLGVNSIRKPGEILNAQDFIKAFKFLEQIKLGHDQKIDFNEFRDVLRERMQIYTTRFEDHALIQQFCQNHESVLSQINLPQLQSPSGQVYEVFVENRQRKMGRTCHFNEPLQAKDSGCIIVNEYDERIQLTYTSYDQKTRTFTGQFETDSEMIFLTMVFSHDFKEVASGGQRIKGKNGLTQSSFGPGGDMDFLIDESVLTQYLMHQAKLQGEDVSDKIEMQKILKEYFYLYSEDHIELLGRINDEVIPTIENDYAEIEQLFLYKSSDSQDDVLNFADSDTINGAIKEQFKALTSIEDSDQIQLMSDITEVIQLQKYKKIYQKLIQEKPKIQSLLQQHNTDSEIKTYQILVNILDCKNFYSEIMQMLLFDNDLIGNSHIQRSFEYQMIKTSFKQFVETLRLSKNQDAAQQTFLNLKKLFDQKKLKIDAPKAGNPNENFENLVDSANNKYCAGSPICQGKDHVIKLIFQSPMYIQGYVFRTGNDMEERDPKNWTVKGRVDGQLIDIDYQDLRTQKTKWDRFSFQEFMLKNPVQITEFHLVVHHMSVDQNHHKLFQICELRLIELSGQQRFKFMEKQQLLQNRDKIRKTMQLKIEGNYKQDDKSDQSKDETQRLKCFLGHHDCESLDAKQGQERIRGMGLSRVSCDLCRKTIDLGSDSFNFCEPCNFVMCHRCDSQISLGYKGSIFNCTSGHKMQILDRAPIQYGSMGMCDLCGERPKHHCAYCQTDICETCEDKLKISQSKPQAFCDKGHGMFWTNESDGEGQLKCSASNKEFLAKDGYYKCLVCDYQDSRKYVKDPSGLTCIENQSYGQDGEGSMHFNEPLNSDQYFKDYNKMQPAGPYISYENSNKAAVIMNATYGPSNVADVIQKLYKDGQRRFTASNSIFGDPEPGEEKELIIKYQFEGKIILKQVREHTGDEILLPDKNDDSWKTKGLDNPLNLQLMKTDNTLGLSGPAAVADQECLDNILIENDSKYCAERSADHTITFKFREPFYVTGYGYKTANDAPSRDPGYFSLLGKKDNSEIVLHTENLTSQEPQSRFIWRKFLVDVPNKVTEIKFVVHRVYQDIEEWGRAIQFSEFQIYSLSEDEINQSVKEGKDGSQTALTMKFKNSKFTLENRTFTGIIDLRGTKIIDSNAIIQKHTLCFNEDFSSIDSGTKEGYDEKDNLISNDYIECQEEILSTKILVDKDMFMQLRGILPLHKLKLLFRGTDEEFKFKNYKSGVYSVSNTLIIYKTVNGRIFGTFTDIAWKFDDEEYVGDSKTFVWGFDLKNKIQKYSHKQDYVEVVHSSEKYMFPTGRPSDSKWSGPHFFEDKEVYAHLSENYNCQKDLNRDTVLCGQAKIKLEEVEIFQVL